MIKTGPGILSEFEIRPYEASDKSDVIDLWREAFPDSPAWNRPSADIRRKLTIQRNLFLVAILKGELVGTAMAGYDGHRGWIYYLAVNQAFRRRGIGRALMTEAEQGLASMGCPKLNLQVRAHNRDVIAFYQRLGYAIEERVSMAKRLEWSTNQPD